MIRSAMMICCLCIGFRADAQVVWDSLVDEASRLAKAGEFAEALQICQDGDSLMLLESSPDSSYLAEFRHQAGNALYYLERYEESIGAFDQAILFSKDDPVGLNKQGCVLFDRAFSEYELARYKQSYQTVKEAEAILSELEYPDYDYLLSIYANLCFKGVDLGYLKEAERYLQKGEKLLQLHQHEVVNQDPNEGSKEVLFEYNYVLLYAGTGEEEKLLAHINKLKAIKKRRSLNEREQYMLAVGLNHVADFYLNFEDRWTGDYPFVQAERYLNEAFAALDHEKYPGNVAQFTFNRNKAFRKSGQYKKAFEGNDFLLSIADSNDFRMPFFIVQRGMIYAASGQKTEAIKAFRRVAELIHAGKEPLLKDYSNFQPSTTVNHADLFAGVMDEFVKRYPEDQEVKELAAELYALALQQFVFTYQHNTFNPKLREFYERILRGILSTRIRENGTETVGLENLLTQIENIENRLAWQEHLQNRRFNALKIPDSLLHKEMNLRREIASAKQRGAPEQEIFEWEDRLSSFDRNMRELYPQHAYFVAEAFDLKALQAQLKPQSLILRFKKAEDHYYLFAISHEDIRYFQLGKKEEIVPEIETLLRQIVQRAWTSQTPILDRLIPIQRAAYHELIIIPDGVLHDLPFEVLKDKSSYLIETHTISYATHLVFVRNQLPKRSSEAGIPHLMAFSPSYAAAAPSLAMRSQAHRLKGAHEEARAVSQFFDGYLYEGKAASKAQFLRAAPEAEVLHLAMHADIHNDKPELSYLLFSTDSPDNKMYVEELYGLNLRAELAVLSACNTGKGSLDERQGMVSLHRAFCYAGVPATVASLWAVPDLATERIMTVFYEKLKQGFSKAEALQQAKLAYLAQTDDPHLQHPFFWGGFVLYGDTEPIQMASQTHQSATLIFAGLLVLAGVIGLFLYQKLTSPNPK
jgi:CHAT domain-containing protein